MEVGQTKVPKLGEDMKKTERLQMIIMALRQKGKMSARDLAEYLHVSMRTIYRDIDALSQMHVPISVYEGIYGGYEIDSSYFMPTVRLTEREVLILMILLKASKQLSLPDFDESIHILNIKLRNACQDYSNKYDKLLEYITMDIQYIFPESYLQGAFETILLAFEQQVKVKIHYFVPLKNNVIERVISPLHFFYSEGCWYLDGFCHLRNKKRTFRLDRIYQVALLPDPVDNILNQQYTSKALDDPKLSIEFDIDKDLYMLIRHDGAMRDACILVEDDKSYRIHIETNRLIFFETLAIRNVDQVTILKPEKLVQSIYQKMLKVLQKYK